MTWDDRFRSSGNVDDRRPGTVKTAAKVAVPAVVLGLGLGWCGQQAVAPEPDVQAPADTAGAFVAHVLGDIEDAWKPLLAERYRPAKLVLYAKSTAKGCGRDAAKSAYGPFYCESNDTIFLDLSFFLEIKTKSCQQKGEACEFARAQIIAHEYGHHVQNILGTLRDDASPVAIELQADCFSGLWAGRSNAKWKNVTPAMLTAGMEVTRLFGDDPRGGPASHGTGAQRSAWFMRGYQGKELASCDTFGGSL